MLTHVHIYVFIYVLYIQNAWVMGVTDKIAKRKVKNTLCYLYKY